MSLDQVVQIVVLLKYRIGSNDIVFSRLEAGLMSRRARIYFDDMPNSFVSSIERCVLYRNTKKATTAPSSGWNNLNFSRLFAPSVVDNHLDLLIDASLQYFSQGSVLLDKSGRSNCNNKIEVRFQPRLTAGTVGVDSKHLVAHRTSANLYTSALSRSHDDGK